MERVSGVYAILGPNGVYVGESGHCWSRGTLATAVKLGLPCGIVRELPGYTRLARLPVEAEVAQLFIARGLPVVSKFSRFTNRAARTHVNAPPSLYIVPTERLPFKMIG